MPRTWCRHAFLAVAALLGLLTVLFFAFLIRAIPCRTWDAATTFATLLAGLVAADVVGVLL